MITFEEARIIAAQYVSEIDHELDDKLILQEEPLDTSDCGWVFMYQNAKYLETDNWDYILVGNAPVLIDRDTGAIHELGTAHPLETYVSAYRNWGDPHAVAGNCVDLLGCKKNTQTVLGMRAIRGRSALGLKASKQLVERCMIGNSTIVETKSSEDAAALCLELEDLGFMVKQLCQS